MAMAEGAKPEAFLSDQGDTRAKPKGKTKVKLTDKSIGALKAFLPPDKQ